MKKKKAKNLQKNKQNYMIFKAVDKIKCVYDFHLAY